MIHPDATSARLDRSLFTIRFERSLDAAREQVFDAWTRPEHVTAWWDPTGRPLSECTIDLRVGGAFRFVNRDHAHGPPFQGTYRVVEPPARLVFEALGAMGTVLLEARGTRTHLTVTIQCVSAEHFDKLVELGVDAGTGRTLDNLVAHLAPQAAATSAGTPTALPCV